MGSADDIQFRAFSPQSQDNRGHVIDDTDILLYGTIDVPAGSRTLIRCTNMTNHQTSFHIRLTSVTLFALALLFSLATSAQGDSPAEIPDKPADTAMTADRLAALILNVDEEAQLDGATWMFHIEDLEVGVVYDILADRMRIIIPIGSADDIPPEELLRLMQANFDSALDARYAIAQGQLWGTFIHPLSELSDDEFLTALGETANIVLSYGTSYSSGLFIFRGGDSAEIQQHERIENLKKKKI